MTTVIDTATSTDVPAALRDHLPAHAVDTAPELLEAYSTDWTRILPPSPAAALVRPSTVEEVQATLRVAHSLGVHVVVRGAGSGLAGGASAIAGGIILSTERLNRILEISPGDELAVVQPGVITADLDRAAGEFGLRYAPDPASSEVSSIGGNIATNAGGLRCAKYGVTRESVLALDVVLADGTLLSVGHRSIKGVTGFDLVGLFVGSEGTLGVVVGATLRLRPLPVRTETLVVFTDSLAVAGAAVEAIVLSGVQPSIVELLDEATLHNIDAHSGSDLAAHGRALLLIQTDGYGADREAQRLLEVTASVGAHGRRVEGAEAERFVELRRSGRGPQPELWGIGEDVAVPRSRLVEMILAIEEIGARHGLLVSTVAHAGDGNLHPGLSIAKRPGETGPPAVLETAADELVRAALALGGTLTGEHGVGLVKRQWLAAELGEEQLALQRSLKHTFDPTGVFAAGFLQEIR
ncbi:glycolate oxidase [Conyzicola lurida]|uniref:Glycolate oxidase n=1 Tax=Conyzicola lurida TaxID=1172621 RepID=A0A841AK85_9MICO|nr:FAD-linked oxidase C-terminal domain-containing protein [Conyzicola lurida]MBB5842824.1 glycolate oxidase [Conyzicola lurida]